MFILFLLILALTATILLISYLYKNEKKGLLYKEFMLSFIFLAMHIVPLIFQILFKDTTIPAIFFDNFSYIGAMGDTICFLLAALTYNNPKINLKKFWPLLIMPVFSLAVLWTNKYHHLFYKVYSIDMSEIVGGIIGNIYVIYTYVIMFLAFSIFIYKSIKNSGFFSKQTFLIILAGIIPVVGNILGTLKILPITIYVTPILFVFTIWFCSIAIIKYKALNITPITTRAVIDVMSDAFIVVSNDGTIVDDNKTFNQIINNNFKLNKDDNLFDFIKENKLCKEEDLKKDIENCRLKSQTIIKECSFKLKDGVKYFELDIQPIKAKKGNNYIATLLLFKDITQHKKDIETIKEKQDIIVKQGQLSSIGELAGGMAHDINTPISAIKSGILMFKDMLGQRTPQELEILQRMDNCADKIIKIVNSMRNQIRNLGSDQIVDFKISDSITDIKVLAYNELTKHNCTLDINIVDDVFIKGDPTKFGQVITNLVVNAIQAYSQGGGKVEIRVSNIPKNMVLISITDYAGGIDEKIKPYIFKNILTTKGTKGTGLGLYLAYSIIKGSFDGDITFESEIGKGTTFYITLPRSNKKE